MQPFCESGSKRGIPFCESMCESATCTPVTGAADHKAPAEFMTRSASLTGLILPMALLLVGAYFTFTAVQGNYGLFQRVQIAAEADRLQQQLAALQAEVARMETLTRRLSDGFLDLDLLDEQARDLLGYVRADEIILP